MSAAYDTAIIGGGLAGCSAAIHLAQQGFRVALIEAHQYPHDKVCGEFLSPECHALLDELGVLSALHALHPTSIDGARITAPGGAVWSTRFDAPGLGISRRALDSALADAARKQGVTVMERTLVTNIQGSLAQGFMMTTRLARGLGQVCAASVIGAYGKRSQLDRVLKRPFWNADQPFVALKKHFDGVSTGTQVDLHTFHGGYCGISAVESGRTNVCLLVRQDVFARFRGDTDKFAAWMQTQNPYLAAWFADATPVSDSWLTIAQIAFDPKAPVEGDLLMAGDSAGLIAPLAGDGMAMALSGGKLAAHWLHAYLSRQISADALRRGYAAAWQSQFRARLRLGRFLQSVMLKPALLALGLRVLNSFPALGRYFVAQTRDMPAVTG